MVVRHRTPAGMGYSRVFEQTPCSSEIVPGLEDGVLVVGLGLDSVSGIDATEPSANDNDVNVCV